MSLIYNGTEIDTIIYNGVQLDKLIYNGITVYESFDFNNSYFYITNTTNSDLEFKIRFKCTSEPLYVYYYYVGDPRGDYKAEVDSGTETLTLSAPANSNLIIELVGGSFTYYNTSNQLMYKEPQLLTKAIIGKNCESMYYLLSYSTELTEIVFAAENTPFNIYSASKLNKLIFKNNPSYIESISYTGLESIVVPENVSSISGINNNPNLKSLTIPNIKMGRTKYGNNTSLEHMYVYTTIESTSKATQWSYAWVKGCNPNLVIHLSASIGSMEQAKVLFGDYFNYISETERATVVFDL